MKKLFFTLVAIIYALNGFCQATQSKNNEDYEIVRNFFSQEFNYPIELFRKNESMGCLIKIEVDKSKHIVDMKLSDSADSLFVSQFNQSSKKLILKWLEVYLKDEYGNDSTTTFLMPLSYTLMNSNGKISSPSGLSVSAIASKALINYTMFSGKYFTGNAIMLKPINFLTGVQR